MGLCDSLLLVRPRLNHQADLAARQRSADRPPPPVTQPGPGSTTTLLPDGRSLIVGGERTEGRAWVSDPQTQMMMPIAVGPRGPRAWHSATLLSDGTVLLLGGRNGNALVETPEVFDPATGVFLSAPMVGAVPRAGQTATL